MFSIKTTKNNLGITISGDYNDLNELYTAISNLVGYQGKINDYDGVVLRILGICYDLRHAFMGHREMEIVSSGIDDETKKWHGKIYPDYNLYYSVNILWIEAIFSVLALEDLINIATDENLSRKYINEDMDFCIGNKEDRKEVEKKLKIEKEIRLPYDISIVRLCQAAIWKALYEAVGIQRYRRLKKATSVDYYFHKPLRYDGFCTQYLDILNIKYINAKSEKRPALLASSIRNLINLDAEYYELESDIKEFARENDISYVDVGLTNIDYPEELEW